MWFWILSIAYLIFVIGGFVFSVVAETKKWISEKDGIDLRMFICFSPIFVLLLVLMFK